MGNCNVSVGQCPFWNSHGDANEKEKPSDGNGHALVHRFCQVRCWVLNGVFISFVCNGSSFY